MHHPDDAQMLRDWYLHGPRRPEIFELVQALTDKGIRVEAIEDQIEAFLRQKLDEITQAETGS